MDTDLEPLDASAQQPPRFLVERLENRLPFTGNPAAVDVELIEVQPTFQTPEFVVAGIANPEVANADILDLEDGGHAIAYATIVGEHPTIFLRRSLANGSWQPPIEIKTFVESEIDPNSPILLRVARAGNDVMVVWAQPDGIHGQRVSTGDQLIGEPLHLVAQDFPSGILIDTVPIDEEQLLIAWLDLGSNTLHSLLVDVASGTTTTPQLLIDNLASSPIDLQLEQDPEADFAVFWTQYDGRATQSTTWYAGFLASGSTVNEPLALAQSTVESAPDAIRMKDGSFAFVGFAAGTAGQETVLQRYSATGELIAEWLLDASSANESYPPSIDVLPPNGFVISYATEVNNERLLISQAIRANGDPLTTPFTMNQSTPATTGGTAVVGLPHGGYAVYWLGQDVATEVMTLLTSSVEPSLVWAEIELEFPGPHSPDDYFLQIEGPPPDVILAPATLVSSETWTVELDAIPELHLLSLDALPVMQLRVDLVDSNTGTTVATGNLIRGTHGPDLLFTGPDEVLVEGLGDLDYLEVDGVSTDFGEPIVDDEHVIYEHLASKRQLRLSGIEFVAFADEVHDLTDLDGPPSEPDLDELEDEELEYLEDFFDLFPEIGAAVGGWLPPPLPPPGPGGVELGGPADWDPGLPPMSGPGAPDALFGPGAPGFEAHPGNLPGEFSAAFGRSNLVGPENFPFSHSSSLPHQFGTIVGNSDVSLSEAAAATLSNPSGPLAPSEQSTPINHRHNERSLTQPSIATSPRQRVTPYLHHATTNSISSVSPRSGFSSHELSNAPPLGQPMPTSTNFSRPTASPILHSSVSTTFMAPRLPAPAKFNVASFFVAADVVDEQVSADTKESELVAGSAVVVATGFSMAHLAWLLRGSVLITKTLSSLPVWVGFDPLPVLDGTAFDLSSGGLQAGESLVDIAGGHS